MRCLFYSTTILPDPSTVCNYRPTLDKQMLLNLLYKGTCHDLIFSGHASIVFLTWKFLEENFGVQPYVGLIHQVVMIFSMMTLRKHYSIDVIVAYLITHYVYNNKEPITNFFDLD